MKGQHCSRSARFLLNGLAIVIVALSVTGCIVEERPAYYHPYHHGYYHHW